jgi:hypothetical protein
VMRRCNQLFVRFLGQDAANAGFFVIDPNNYVLGHPRILRTARAVLV